MKEKTDIPGVCVSDGGECETSKECYGVGVACVDGKCEFQECNVDPTREGENFIYFELSTL